MPFTLRTFLTETDLSYSEINLLFAYTAGDAIRTSFITGFGSRLLDLEAQEAAFVLGMKITLVTGDRFSFFTDFYWDYGMKSNVSFFPMRLGTNIKISS